MMERFDIGGPLPTTQRELSDVTAIRELIDSIGDRDSSHLTLEQWYTAVSGPEYRVARHKETGRIMGVIGLMESREELGVIESVAVHPDFRSRGLATEMIRRVVDGTHGRFNTLITFALPPADRAFGAAGFVTDGEVTSSGEVIMMHYRD